MTNSKRLYNVYAVVNGQPITKINQRRMNKALAEAKAERLLAEGAARAYAVKD